jgi:filamentous hemagglutinin
VETDPQYANYRNWLSSDYLLNALKYDPALTQKRLGDGFYEQKLINDQVLQLTGRRFLDGYQSDEDQYQALMQSGVAFAEAYQLVPGVALSAAQMAQLTHDIVWLVEKTITLADGSTVQALVPQLYVHVQPGELSTGGALVSGNQVIINASGNVNNYGTIAGRELVLLTADNINNVGGRVTAANVGLTARTDVNNLGGQISATDVLQIKAGRDVNVVTTTSTQTSTLGSNTQVNRVAGLYVSGNAGQILVSAGNNVNLVAAVVANQGIGNTVISAGNNVNLSTVTESQQQNVVFRGRGVIEQYSMNLSSEVGSAVIGNGNVSISAGNDINARAANVGAGGQILLDAGRDVNLTTGVASSSSSSA